MSTYPVLAKLGIKNPAEIDRHFLYSTRDKDNLSIVYKRKKRSLLPSSHL